jgi:hypothetical protein
MLHCSTLLSLAKGELFLYSRPRREPCALHKNGSTMSNAVTAGWRSAFKVLKANYSLNDDAIGVFAINLRFSLDDIQVIAAESITGGGDDKNAM